MPEKTDLYTPTTEVSANWDWWITDIRFILSALQTHTPVTDASIALDMIWDFALELREVADSMEFTAKKGSQCQA